MLPSRNLTFIVSRSSLDGIRNLILVVLEECILDVREYIQVRSSLLHKATCAIGRELC